MSEEKMSYCQSCVRETDELQKVMITGRPYWLCSKCTDPLPRESYQLRHGQRNKAWGKYKNRGTKNS